MKIKRSGSAAWQGGIKDGKGTISTQSGALNAYPYGFASRFEGQRGSNPEELIAAAHAACFSMAFSSRLAKAGTPATLLETSAEVDFTPGTGITAIRLTVRGDAPGLAAETFRTLAEDAKENCPVSSALKGNVELTLDARLQS